LPAPRFGYSIAAFDGKVYLFGGWDGGRFVNSVLRYDPTTDRWSQHASMSISRGFSGAAVIGKLIYMVGGYADGREFNTCERYWPEEDRWEACAPMTVARGGLGLVTVGDRLYALGGGWTGYLTFSERYDPQVNAWSVVPTPFVGQWRGMGVTTIGNDVYALGGWSGGQYLSVVEKYNPFPFNIFVPAATR
jgi:kelch-like protein 10